jgi:hypothetical protein
MRHKRCKFACDRPKIKDTLPGQWSISDPVPRPSMEWFSWNVMSGTHHTYTKNGVSLVTIGKKKKKEYLRFYWTGFPKTINLTLQNWLKSQTSLPPNMKYKRPQMGLDRSLMKDKVLSRLDLGFRSTEFPWRSNLHKFIHELKIAPVLLRSVTS